MTLNLKNIVLGILVLLLVFLVVSWRIRGDKIRVLEKTKTRLEGNSIALLDQNRKISNLVLSEKEVSGRIKRERDSIAELLRIRPKQIVKMVHIDLTFRDLVPALVPVRPLGRDSWEISDSTKCFIWKGIATRRGDSLQVTRTSFEDFKEIDQVFYKKRPFNVWFIHLGKWKYYQEIGSNCGDPRIETIEFIKKDI